MPRVIFSHEVNDTAHWASKHEERVSAFKPWGTDVVDFLAADGSKFVSVSVDVDDLKAMQEAMTTPEMEAAKQSHGVKEPIWVFIEKS